MTGGWNNTDMFTTQFFDFSSKSWVTMGYETTSNDFDHAWSNRGVRSGAVVDLGQTIYHAGGVVCTG